MVQDPAGAEVAAVVCSPVARPGLRVAGLLVCAILLGGCSGGGSGSDGPAKQAGATIGGSVRNADCAGWRAAGPPERKNTVSDISAFAGGPAGERIGNGATLSEDKAYDLFEGACRADYARGFKLYKLYTRAAAFQKQKPPNR